MTTKRERIIALLSPSGTACSETVLHGDEDTPKRRAEVERMATADTSLDAPVPGTWTDVSDNEALQRS